MNTKILITGGAGFIGRHLVEKLLSSNEGIEITVLDDFSTGKKENLLSLDTNGNILDIVTGDIRDEKILDSILPGTCTVYHMAAVVGVDRVLAMPIDTWDVEVNGTRILLERCASFGVKRFFLASSSECYGRYDTSQLPMKESHEITPNTDYGRAKLECEKMCSEYISSGRISCVIVRYFNVYGRQQSLNGYVIPHMIEQALSNEPVRIYGHGDQTRDFMYIDDAVDATIKLTESACEGVYNVGSGENIKIIDIAKKIIDLTGSGSVIAHVPIRRPTDIENKLSDSAKIKEALSWKPVHDIQSGLKKTIDYNKRCLNECNCNRGTS
ncbi:MAG: NAD-dependent epimerase/dehydratase family protein [archaeon]